MTRPYQPSEKPVAWRVRYRSEPGMIGHYPWSYTERKRSTERPEHEYESLFTASQLAAEVERAVAAETERCSQACQAICMDLINDVHVRLGAAKCVDAIRKGTDDATGT